jgi:hypothetical protein
MARTCDAFYARLNKNLTVDEKRRVLRNSRESFAKAQKEHPELKKMKLNLDKAVKSTANAYQK